ncbi:unnamed protein product [Ilex paraguariensis]|uniref:C2H2-type domain-containing protein n=1 Tax=Ilex paraguariensis TaxID=185542 RepID=A0ABC8UUL5_9AQUA
MEQARCWMWTKRKHGFNSHILASTNPSYGDSWEEQAFAEDAAGALGGCIWPPRSYSCSFCRREFRSAQALGGHMNVHRRDRARLKQSPSPQNEILHHQNNFNHILNPCTSLDVQHPSQICTLLYNPSSDADHRVFASPSSASGVKAPPTLTYGDEKTLVPPFSPIFHEFHKRTSISSPPSRSNMAADRHHHILDFKNEEKNSKILESNGGVKGEYVTADLSVSLNLVLCRTNSTPAGAKEEAISCKRRRTDDGTPLALFSKSSTVDRHHQQSEVFVLSPNPIEDLDLELRLGERPKGFKVIGLAFVLFRAIELDRPDHIPEREKCE